MKRLFKISFDLLFFSLIPILQWFILGFLVDKNLINVFALTYPLQFVYSFIKSVFGVSPNIKAKVEDNKNIVMSGLIFGSCFSLIIFGLFALNVDGYIEFMNMDVSVYKNFCIYSIIQLCIHSIFALFLEKLYYDDKNTEANIHTILFNILNIIAIVLTSVLFKNQLVIINISLISLVTYVLIMFVLYCDDFVFDLEVFKCIKYDSVDSINAVLYFLIYIFGFSNSSSFGIEYMAALNFVALITDTQWDSFEAISESAKIDLAEGVFDYKKSLKNAYVLLSVLILSTFIMFLILYGFYDLNINLVIIYLLIEIFNFIIYPIYRLRICYLQLEYSSVKTTFNMFISSGVRFCVSFFKTPFCTNIGQTLSSIYQVISTKIFMNISNKESKKLGDIDES